ncbi:DUF4255 domain-containing protein [Aequorivita sp. H23M31]|uniref:DUF4255 domain-containing protein n=1 Tax=Aequorivita ciconiae TaxID=2494375 RepID=A0A410G3J1_9FLAO|nr:Pvc16 family protein [Aequorivita sp. H23M31]QAA81830.1 DUF4255 domain-containing protein [Aequorivita sp. H23M31]
MEYTSLKEITGSIIEIIQVAADNSGNWNPKLKVLPEILRDQNNGIGFYLFHTQESNYYKNFPAPGNDSPPVSFTPMALNLFYQLSANSTKENDKKDVYDEQEMMAVAMKALHDNSHLKITSSGKKINLKITLQTLTPSESVQYWAASESSVRLSAYYEVSVVFLEPQKPLSYAGRVLSYGNFVFVRGAPQITSSESMVEYILPGEVVPKNIKISPAQAPINNTISFLGTGFNGGSLKILLISPLWPEPAVADAAWSPTLISENQLDLTLQPTAKLLHSGSTRSVIPGLYAARVNLTEIRSLPNGTAKTFDHISNQFPFSVMPRITSISDESGGFFKVKCEVFQHADMTRDDVQIYIGEEMLTLSPSTPSSGGFQITDPTTVMLKVPTGLQPGNVPLRILIRGIESEPKWISIP